MNVVQRLRNRAWVITRAGDRRWHNVDARWRKFVMRNWRDPILCTLKLWAWPSDGTAHHIPDNHAINLLATINYVRAEACMDSRPGVQPWVRPCIHTEAPND